MARVRSTALEARAQSGDRQAERALQITRQLDAYLTATQFGITLASLALGWLGEPAIAALVRPSLTALGVSERALHAVATTLAFSTITVLHIVIGELVPKSLAIMHPEQVSLLTAQPMRLFYLVMRPILVVLNGFSNWLLSLMGLHVGSEQAGDKLSVDEIRLVVQAAFVGEDQAHKRELLERVLRATDRPVRSLMVPRVDMTMLSLDQDYATWLSVVRQQGFSRYPVCEDGDPDRIVGYLYVKDLLLAGERASSDLRALKRDVLFLPESTSAGDVLARFKRSNIPMGVVVDEYGGTAGLVTVEDVVEELVGELRDETDDEQLPGIEHRPDGALVVDGSVPLGDLPSSGLDEETRASGDTLGGYILERLGRLASPGDRVQLGRYDAVVEDVRRRRIGRVALTLRAPTTQPPSDGTSPDDSG
jgi:CBS domain containing-hemolysin-like protein